MEFKPFNLSEVYRAADASIAQAMQMNLLTMQAQQARREYDDEQGLREAWKSATKPDGSMDLQAFMYSPKGDPIKKQQLVQGMQKAQREERQAGLTEAKTRAELTQEQWEMIGKLSGMVLDASPQERPNIYARVVREAQTNNLPEANSLPAQWDEQLLPEFERLRSRAIPAKDAMEEGKRRKLYGEQGTATPSTAAPERYSDDSIRAANEMGGGSTVETEKVLREHGKPFEGSPAQGPQFGTGAVQPWSTGTGVQPGTRPSPQKLSGSPDEEMNPLELRKLAFAATKAGLTEDATRFEAMAKNIEEGDRTRLKAEEDAQKRLDEKDKQFNADTSAVRKEFNALDDVKNYKAVVPVLASIANAPNTTAGDLDFIYGVGKILDPGSVVREGEMALVIKSGSPLERILGTTQWVGGEGKLTKDLREELLEVLNSRVTKLRASAEDARSPFMKQVKRQGLNVEETLQLPGLPKIEAKKQTDNAPKVGTVENGYEYIGGDPSKPGSWKKVK